jgi:hypothetical protein
MPGSFSQRVTVPPETMIRIIDGQAVLLSLKSERYFGLDEAATHMWQVLTESESIQAAYDTLLSQYNVNPETLRRDLSEWIDKLVENGLVEVGGG